MFKTMQKCQKLKPKFVEHKEHTILPKYLFVLEHSTRRQLTQNTSQLISELANYQSRKDKEGFLSEINVCGVSCGYRLLWLFEDNDNNARSFWFL